MECIVELYIKHAEIFKNTREEGAEGECFL